MSGLAAAGLLAAGLLLVVWGAERFTDGAVRLADGLAVSPFVVGAVVSGFEPENLATGLGAALGGLPQVALGTVVGSAVFLLTGGLGLALLLAPMAVRVPRAGPLAMLAALAASGAALATGGGVGRGEGGLLVLAALALLGWLWRGSPAPATVEEPSGPARGWAGAGVRLVAGLAAMVGGAELVVHGARGVIADLGVSETFLGMAVVGLGESVEETARMVVPARRGHPELALGNVVGTVVALLALNLGLLALVRPLAVDPLVLRLHVPFLAGVTLLAAALLAGRRRLGRGAGLALAGLYVLYLGLNLAHLRP